MPTGWKNQNISAIDLQIPSTNMEVRTEFYKDYIKRIEIAGRDSVLSNFRQITYIPYPEHPILSLPKFRFEGGVGETIENSEALRTSDSVPRLAGALESYKNQVLLGDCTEGYDFPEDYTITGITWAFSNFNNVVFKMGTSHKIGVQFYDDYGRSSGVKDLGVLSAPFEWVEFRGNIPSFTLNGMPPIWATHYKILITECLEYTYFIQGWGLISQRNGTTTEIIFNPINQDAQYSPSEGDELTTPRGETDRAAYKILGVAGEAFGLQTIRIQGTLKVNYSGYFFIQIASPRKNTTNMLYYETPQVHSIFKPGTYLRSLSSSGSRFITLNGFSGHVYMRQIEDCLAAKSHCILEIRNTGIPGEIPLSIMVNGTNVRASTTGAGRTEVEIGNKLCEGINSLPNTRAFLFKREERTEQSTTGSQVGFAIVYAMVYRTDESDLSIQTNVSTFTPSFISLFGVVTGIRIVNNIISYNLATGITQNRRVEAINCNSKNERWDNNTGKASVILNNPREIRRKNIIRFGGRRFLGTEINLIHTFSALDQEELISNSPIRKLILASNSQASDSSILLAIQENEISSLYLGQTVLKNSGGGQNIVASDKFIGTVNSLKKQTGTINPESVCQLNGNVYGFDAARGIVWRYGQDGLSFISEETGGGVYVGMKVHFLRRSEYLMSLNSAFECPGQIDSVSNDYILTTPNTNADQQTIVWSERVNKWTSFMTFVGESYARTSNAFVSFKNGQLWIHKDSNTYNNFHGVQGKSVLKFVHNKNPMNSKILKMIEEVSTGQWDVVEIKTREGLVSELIGLYDLSNPDSVPADFRKYENRYSAVVLRASNTPNMEENDFPLIKGDLMRSDVFDLHLEYESTEKQYVQSVDVYFDLSMKVT